jgi:hypothetical protein
MRLSVLTCRRITKWAGSPRIPGGKPRATVDRQLQALHIIGGVLTVNEIEQERGSSWYYHVADHSDPAVLTLPEMLVSKDSETQKGEETDVLHTNIFGNREAP